MSACAICLDTLKSPVALPCGHVYCHGCISQAIKAMTGPSSPVAHCPTCRERVFIVTPNPLLIPPHLRPFLLSPFRRLYLNGPTPPPSPSPILSDLSSPTLGTSVASPEDDDGEKVIARLGMENAVLRQSCHAWRARSNAHVAAQLGLSALVRLARDQARRLRDERDELARKYDTLKRKFSDVHRGSDEGESDFISHEALPQTLKTSLQADDVPCVPLICPPDGVASPVSDSEPLERSSKRRRMMPALRLEHSANTAPSIPAMVIPHLISP
ncbi:hypothetical protein BGW80DRAFT_1295815 [Lactifluus volemus]|nr:hypothetical protein BGW80DRAFT_1295815 [Lactifluus volemus]